ncbi:MAG TPA: hypothetical protein VNJ02_19185, partial [Vicinamibacterales bacterium]|nr:hypothetical protein [Vicinamibacterales bacterium]
MRIVLSFATRVDWHEGYQVAHALRTLGHEVQIVDARDGGDHWNPDVGLFAADAHLNDVAPTGTDLFLYIEPQGLLPRG